MGWVTGLEPFNSDFSNMVMARDFWRKCFDDHHFPAYYLSSPVNWNPLDSTPVVETLWRRHSRRNMREHEQERAGAHDSDP